MNNSMGIKIIVPKSSNLINTLSMKTCFEFQRLFGLTIPLGTELDLFNESKPGMMFLQNQ